MATYPTAAVDRLNGYNGDRYNPQTNPLGFAIGGHRQNFVPSLRDTASVAAYIAAAAGEVGAAADQTADDRRQTGEDRAAAANSAAQAAKFDPANFVRRDGTQGMTGRLDLVSGTADRAGLNVGQRGSLPNSAANGDVWGLATGLWGFLGGVTRQFYDTTSLPAPTNAEIDAGSNTLRKAWSVLDVWRAARAALPLPAQAQAEAGTLATPGSWSPERDAQAIAALAARGASLSGAQGVTSVSVDTAIAFADFTATGPAVFGIGNVSLEGATTTLVRARVELYRNTDNARFYVGPEIVTRHVAGSIERIPVPFVFTNLLRNTSYRARIFISADSTISTTSQIQGICA